jgi:hypothetical protein
MQRLCGRPGCSDPATVAYGMRADDLVFWLDVLPDDRSDVQSALCGRHADTMVVPRGWTLDDLRDPDLHLFRPPNVDIGPRPVFSDPTPKDRRSSGPHRSPRRDPVGEQLRLGVEAEPAPDDAVEPGPWTPAFDEADDLDGLLSARGPLLSRAFRTAGRNRS